MKLTRSISLALLTFLLILPSAFSETVKTDSFFDAQNGEISITSDSYELDMKNSTITFKGDVNIVSKDISMSCQKLELYFENSLKDISAEESNVRIEKIAASESVVITRPDKGSVTAEKAVYFHDDEKIVLTGNPMVRDSERFEGGGNKIILFLKEDRYVVEGAKDKKAKFSTTGNDER